jgi:Co/Zn/Cd efflux system component
MSHSHSHGHPHGHSHGLVDPAIIRSRAGVRAVTLSLGVLGVAALLQGVVFAEASQSVSLLGDVIHVSWSSWRTVRGSY